MGKVNSRRELRVFLSSTFRDMQFERNYLVKHIFPELKLACRARHVEFIEVDFRLSRRTTSGRHLRFAYKLLVRSTGVLYEI
jgi:hypothetical protein